MFDLPIGWEVNIGKWREDHKTLESTQDSINRATEIRADMKNPVIDQEVDSWLENNLEE